jgi:hypothetical protein
VVTVLVVNPLEIVMQWGKSTGHKVEGRYFMIDFPVIDTPTPQRTLILEFSTSRFLHITGTDQSKVAGCVFRDKNIFRGSSLARTGMPADAANHHPQQSAMAM